MSDEESNPDIPAEEAEDEVMVEEDDVEEDAPLAPGGFALTPARAIQGVLDLRTKSGIKIYETATAPLPGEPFNCKPDGLPLFLQNVKHRARRQGWQGFAGILEIPRDLAVGIEVPDTDNLLDHYGEITIERIRGYEESYIHLAVRAAQDSAWMFDALMASLSTEGKQKVMIWDTQYMVGEYQSGNLLLKVIIRESHLDTNATTVTIRRQLSSLDTYIVTIGSDIIKFNGYVKLLISSLTARGETSSDILTNLFKGYEAASDKNFVDYIARKKEQYEEDMGATPPFTIDSLMELAANKFKNLQLAGKWNAPSEQEETILALNSQLQKLKREKKKFNRDGRIPRKPKKDEQKASDKPNWLKYNAEPKEGELNKPRVWKDKKWYYCHEKTGGKCDGKYRLHKPSECKGSSYKFPKDADKGKHSQKKLKLAKSLAAIVQSDDESN